MQLSRSPAALAVTLAVLGGGIAAAQTQLDLDQKADAQRQAADRKLSATYAQILAEASPAGRLRLRQAQRAWLKFRDSDCAARTGSRDGSIYPMLLAGCLTKLTDDRVRQLAGELRCREGDLGCGGHRES